MIVRRTNGSPSELFHHGIKNQHWGVRNGPPYPLDRKVSARIKKGHNEKLRDKKREGTSHYTSVLGGSYRYPTGMSFKEAKSLGEKYRDNESHLQETIFFKNNDGSLRFKNILEATDVSDFVGSNMKSTDSSYNHLRLDENIKRDIRKNGFSNHIDILRRVNVDETRAEYGHANNYGTIQNNCSKCSDLVELISRGLDPNILSAGRTQYGMLSTATEYHWDGAIPYKEKSLENIERRIKSFGNHGSGTIGVRRADGSGHSMHFSAIAGGGVEVQDGQTAETYNSIAEALTAEGHDFNQFCKITRLDCATPNIKHMAEDSVLRMDSSYASLNRFDVGVSRNDYGWWGSNDNNTFTEWGKKK